MPVPLRAVITDVDGTLYRQGPVRGYVAVRLVRHAIFHPVRAWKTIRALAAYRHAQEGLRATDEPGSARRQTAQAARRTGFSETFVSECVELWMNSVPLQALVSARRPGLIPFLDWARGAGIRLAVVSDYDAERKLRALGVGQYFPVVVSAQDREVGVFKPNPRGLLVALRRLEVEPGEALYVGDRLEVDGAAAVAAGMAGAIITPEKIDSLPGVVSIDSWIEVRGLIEARAQSVAFTAG